MVLILINKQTFFTPLHISNGQSMPLITASKAGGLNVKSCKKYIKNILYIFLYINACKRNTCKRNTCKPWKKYY
jgi:hypothetical protein